MTVIAAGFALTIRDADAAGTMRRREPVPATAAAPPVIGEGTADLG